ncbi:MAG: hydrogenase 3 maturation endopeptidase HyCI [Thermoplasmata archaeon]|nr:hydrogenase 3 maturation endopeptidase HyCI [Thermoplasmata archaeon]MBE3136704.1 hydrogenase 3 maturation endopeptidase HyCI [Thermoplasmata archaeon]MBE3141972.1 hydrogenase 3 maturation endopeptidase HyCI [Thermoplasmata archaeon]
MCIGNRDGGDDGIGPHIADTLKIDSLDFVVLDCGTTPENYTAVVKRHKPKTLVLIDAADMGLAAGDIRIIPKEKLGSMHISTHGIPLSILIQYLEKEVEHVIFIGIQPQTMFGEISKPVKKSAEQLIELLKKKKIDQIKIL